MVLLCGCGSQPRSAVKAAQTTIITIPAADRFAPTVTVVNRGATVSFHNGDHDPHTVTSTPDDPAQFDVELAPGASKTLTLTVAGAYRFYCRLHARFDAGTDQIAALPNADHPNEPMAGFLFVA